MAPPVDAPTAASVADVVDVVVVGGGPAGAAAAARLARCGHTALVLEREPFPRFHIGESLLPLGGRVFEELGCRDAIERVGFVQKHGARLHTPDGAHTVLFDFAAQNLRPATTIQVHRARFDALLMQHAEACGARSVLGSARSYAIDAAGVTVEYAAADGALRAVRARAIVDASGRSGFVAKREGVRVQDTELQKAAIYAHFRGVPRDAGPRGGDTHIVSLPNLGWLWLIPLQDGVTSVGAVLDVADYRQQDKGDLAAIFAAAVQSAPFAARLLAGAERVSEFAAESGFSYRAERYAGDRWYLCGDAGSFLDPVFSTGVQMAMLSGVEAADAIAGWLGGAVAPHRAAMRYDRLLQRRYWFVRRFVTGFYDPATRDLFFAPRAALGIHRAVLTVLAGGFELGRLDRLRLALFFLLGRLQRRFDLVPRLAGGAPAAVASGPAAAELP